MGTTNYCDTFIAVAEDCRATAGTVPPAGARPTVAALTYELISAAPYALTSDDVLFTVHAIRHGIPEAERARAREEFFARPQPCLRSSPLGKSYGWGVHSDGDGRVALVGRETERYRVLTDPAATTPEGRPIAQTRAMRSSRR
ncbi:DUF6157 family protein [Georgenia sp. SYP-B2076]|uniref:DUF6157 family protein n=1 Tax=Georgenia sp. SYP-B2076 TaxID=2495881 RepID=UPI000F8CCEC7|nr:DUF6157 family protein [Georgenia sp. SYP-B2076]